MMIATTVTVATGIFQQYNNRIEEMQERLEEISSEWQEQEDTINDHAQTISEISVNLNYFLP